MDTAKATGTVHGMTVEMMERFTSMLALVALAGALGIVVLRIVARWSSLAASLVATLAPMGLWLAFLVAAAATAGSLYFSEVAHFTPCRLCWFQRIAMYPLVTTLLVAAIRKDRAARWYVLPQAVIGLGVAAYHYLIEWYPNLEKTACDLSAPCTAVWFRGFGFVSLAFMAGAGFLAIIALVTLPGTSSTDDER